LIVLTHLSVYEVKQCLSRAANTIEREMAIIYEEDDRAAAN
jgi:hypothetical protein